jgi:hypothetical protein
MGQSPVASIRYTLLRVGRSHTRIRPLASLQIGAVDVLSLPFEGMKARHDEMYSRLCTCTPLPRWSSIHFHALRYDCMPHSYSSNFGTNQLLAQTYFGRERVMRKFCRV